VWFVILGLLAGIGCLVAIAKNLGLFVTLGLPSAGSCLPAAAFLSEDINVQEAGGWIPVASAAAAVYTAAALLAAESYGRTDLSFGTFRKDANVPGRVLLDPIEYPLDMPSARVGQ
jgi:succinate-acetate transporter protein